MGTMDKTVMITKKLFDHLAERDQHLAESESNLKWIQEHFDKLNINYAKGPDWFFVTALDKDGKQVSTGSYTLCKALANFRSTFDIKTCEKCGQEVPCK